MEQRPLAKLEGTLLGAVDVGARKVRRQQVGCKLQAMEIAFDALRQHLDRACLGETGSTLDEQVSVAKQSNEHAIDQVRLPDNQAAGVRLELLELFCDAH